MGDIMDETGGRDERFQGPEEPAVVGLIPPPPPPCWSSVVGNTAPLRQNEA